MSAIPVLATAPQLDERPAAHRIGVIVLATDHTSERDFAAICPRDEVALYVTRVAYENPTTPANLLAMQPRLTQAASLILPGEALDAIAFSCTAASALIGDEAVHGAIAAAKPSTPVVTPAAAAVVAFAALGVRRIALLTPYTPEVTAPLRDYFAAQGLEILAAACLGLDDDREMARVSPASIVEAAEAVCPAGAEAVFLSCTALRAAGVAAEIEARTKRPAVTSNQAMIWLSLRHAGYGLPIQGYGRLLTLPGPAVAEAAARARP
jgi:maleate isomerase